MMQSIAPTKRSKAWALIKANDILHKNPDGNKNLREVQIRFCGISPVSNTSYQVNFFRQFSPLSYAKHELFSPRCELLQPNHRVSLSLPPIFL